jgi:branched-chain amino acid transport system permease protein
MKLTPLTGWLFLRGAVVVGVLGVIALGPLLFTGFITSSIGVQSLVLGIAAASLLFLSAYGGMVSLAQTALYGIAAYTTAALTVNQGANPWIAALAGVAVTVAVGLLFGAVISRSEGIYFLMITLAFGVITFSFFSQVTAFGSHEGINAVTPPGLIGHPFVDPTGLYYAAVIASVAVYLLVVHLRRTPFGFALQGVRDEPVRMRALGYNVVLIRILAFAVGAFIASVAGVLLVWYNSDVSPGTIDLTRTIDLLTIAVIGGLGRLAGAWIGALLFTVVETYSPAYTDRFETIIGLVFLAVVLVSPGGIAGILATGDQWIRRRLGEGAEVPEAAAAVEAEAPLAPTGAKR